MSITNLSSKQLRQAADLKEKIAALENELNQLLGTKTASVTASKPAKRKGMSAAGKAKIAAAQKLRWAKVNAAKGRPAAPKPAKKKFKMSAEAKSKISAAAKTRWAKIKAEKK